MTGSKEKITYGQLLEEVEVLAGVLREEGVRKGDVVVIYSMFDLESFIIVIIIIVVVVVVNIVCWSWS